MATGYTAGVADGKVTEFPDFAMQCARAFGALIMMRDDPHNAEIPEEFEPSTFYAERLAEARERLAVLEAMTPDGIVQAAQASNEQAAAAFAENRARQEKIVARYRAMLEKVEAWVPPSLDHVEMKDFMRQQLESSIDFDSYDLAAPEAEEAGDWYAREVGAARRDITRYAEEHEKEVERTRERNRWVRQLRGSLEETKEATHV